MRVGDRVLLKGDTVKDYARVTGIVSDSLTEITFEDNGFFADYPNHILRLAPEPKPKPKQELLALNI